VYIFAGSGGGLNGSHHGGVIEAFNSENIVFDGFVGISTGALAAGFMSQYKNTIEFQKNGIADYKKTWLELKSIDDILQLSKLRAIWRIITGKPSIGTLVPLEKRIDNYIKIPPKVPCGIGVVSLNNAKYETLYPQTIDDLKEAMLASCSMPVYSPPIGTKSLMDGGMKHVSGLAAAFELIKRNKFVKATIVSSDCWDWPAPEVLTIPEKRGFADGSILKLLYRCQDIVSRYSASQDLWTSELINEVCQILDEHGIERPEKLNTSVVANIIPVRGNWGYGTFEYDIEKIKERWNRGYLLAKDKIKSEGLTNL
jgi:hypothetical protein